MILKFLVWEYYKKNNMFGIKTKAINHFKKMFKVDNLRNKPISFIEEKILIKLAQNELKNELKFINLQSPVAKKTNLFAARIIRATADYMPNNLGNWSIKKPYTFTGKIELNLVELIKKYYMCPKNVIGHFGSGATEGNIYASWIGRNFLIKKLSLKNSEKIVLIKSCLAHYSIDKAADITNIKLKIASIDEKNFKIDLDELKKQVKNLYDDKYRGFLIPLTVGYTLTGTEDDYEKICIFINKFEKDHKDCAFFLWIDCAFSGISKILTNKTFRPFSNNKIKLFTTDFHKVLAIPYSSNIILYRNEMIKYIKKDIPYIDQYDTTLLGSRSGTNVLAAWHSLTNINNKKIKRSVKEAFDKKNTFLKNISKKYKKIKIINNQESFQACLLSNNNKESIMMDGYKLEKIEQNLLIKGKVKKIALYKLYFFPNF